MKHMLIRIPMQMMAYTEHISTDKTIFVDFFDIIFCYFQFSCCKSNYTYIISFTISTKITTIYCEIVHFR